MTLAVALIYFAVLIIGAGIITVRKVKSSGDFTAATGAGGMGGWFVVMCTFVLIPLGSGHSMSLWEMATVGGMGAGALLWAIAVGAIFLPIMMLFFGPLVRRTGFKTIPEITKAMYGRAFGWIHAAVASSSLSGIIAAELIGTGVAIYTLSGGAVQLSPAIIIAFVFALLYIFFGGILQMAWINIANAIMLIAGSFAAVIGMAVWVGKNVENGFAGIAEIYATNPELDAGNLNQYTNALDPTIIMSIIIPVALMHLCSIAISQGHNLPFFAARSQKDIRKGVYLASVINAMSAVPWVLIGLVAFALPAVVQAAAPEVGKLIVPVAALQMLPNWLTGLLMISLLSATLSTAGAITLGAAQQITTNIIKDALFPKMSDKTELWLIRIMCVVYLVVCLFMALNLPVIMPVFFFCFMLNIPIFFCYITGMFITINRATCYITLIGGYIVAFWWTFAPPSGMPFPLGDTTWAVIVISALLGLVLPLILKKQGQMSLNQRIKIARGQVDARIAE